MHSSLPRPLSRPNCIEKTPRGGAILELGSGAGFVKEVITSDTIAYDGVDRVIDATRIPFADSSVRAICMLNVFHHIPDVEAFLGEAQRCLVPGGRILIVDQNPGWISGPILKYAHHEPFVPDANDWRFESSGPLSGANGALAWIVFKRDLKKFQGLFPELRLLRFEPHTPLRYWLSGGLKPWSLLPQWAFRIAWWFDRFLVKLTPSLGSFVDIELLKTE